MLPKVLLTFATMLVAVSALPNKPVTTTSTTTTKWTTSTTKATSAKPTSTIHTTTTTGAAPAPTNNGAVFINQCKNYGISIADCTSLLNIAALNGNTVVVGGSPSSSPAAPVNNGLLFLNECKNFGISVLDCAELLNLALLNGNTIDINLQAVVSLLAALGIPTGILGGILPTGTGLITLPTGLL